MALTTTRVYQSTDPGAPVLTGQVGSLVDALSKCLIGTAGVAYGSGANTKAPAGWSSPFANTATKAVFANSQAAGGTGMCARVDDGASGTGGARQALVRVYRTMSDIDTGVDQTPTAAQLAPSITVWKSDTADATARKWILVADELTFYMWIESAVVASPQHETTWAAGDFDSHVAGDAYRFFISGGIQQTTVFNAVAGMFQGAANGLATPSPAGFYVGRAYSQSGSPIAAALLFPGSTSMIGSSNAALAYPSAGSAQLYFIPALITCENTIRGRMRGMYVPLNSFYSRAGGEIISSPVGAPAGSTLISLRNFTGGGATLDGHLAVESILPWS